MAVIPGGSHPVPDGAKQSGSDLALIQNLTDADVRNQIKSQALLPWQSAHGSFFTNIIGGIGKALWDGINGVVNSIGSWAGSFFNAGVEIKDQKDFQTNLNDRTDLLSPLLDYCSVYAPPGVNGHARFGTGIMPFTEQIGPAQNVAIASPGRLVLGDKGLWDIRAQVVPSWTGLTNPSDIRLGIRVLYPAPNDQVFSQQTMIEKTTNVTSFTVVSSVVVPDPGYMVEVYVEQMDSNRGILGGPKWSRLTVQHISRDVENNTGAESSTDNPSQNGPS